ncbi:hypothetical protein HPB47_024278 [Ixodes persulcatus]|uniref:Uncharacterized protein n=1 Tax=Ixodes persulcatus TaxID=34615 RepID=A0AC60Q4R6_IXOPE|nr:hypothetical protein HPB47_024278 [Ixodes persulcatus]
MGWRLALTNYHAGSTGVLPDPMAQFELDPLFLKALRLLHSKARDSSEQLRQLLEDTLNQRQQTGSATGRDTRSLLTTIKLESDLKKSPSLSRRQSPKQEMVVGETPPTLVVPRPPPEEKSHQEGATSAGAQAASRGTPTAHRQGQRLAFARDAKRVRTESPQQPQLSRSSSPLSRATTCSSPTTSSDGEDLAVDMGQVCVMCNQLDVTAKNQLIECQECHCLYHQECHRPPATDYDVNDPRLVWYCAHCTKNMKKMAIKPPKPASKVAFGVPRELTPPIKADTPPPLTSQPFKRSELKVPALSSAGGPNKPIGLAGLAANLSKPKPLKPPLAGLSSLAGAAVKAGPTAPIPVAPPRPGNGNNGGGSAAAAMTPNVPSPGGGNGKPASSSSLMSAEKRLQMLKKKAAAAKMQDKRRVTNK